MTSKIRAASSRGIADFLEHGFTDVGLQTADAHHINCAAEFVGKQ